MLDLPFLEQDGESTAEALRAYETKVQQLERELFFYKKTSRELKKKLKDLVGESVYHPLTQSKWMSTLNWNSCTSELIQISSKIFLQHNGGIFLRFISW